MSPQTKTRLGNILAAALSAAAFAAPAPWDVVAGMAVAALLGALHIPRPGDVKAPKAP
jgi:hypothetical protein